MSKHISKILTGILTLMLIMAAGTYVKANNYQDTYDTAKLDEASGITEDYTTGRYKADYSAGYAKNIRSSYDEDTLFTLVASDGDGSHNHYEDFELHTSYLRPGESEYLINFVKESRYDYAAMKVEPGSSGYMETYFAWSPDNCSGY